ncbi:Resistin [Tupaia chinensis]|uniref:Resistin n=1 Tax=Tupaia chinensis TaxID=246437 RepID=L8Y6M0_TUPCH|nr:Resistin [Tupaia chinensis]
MKVLLLLLLPVLGTLVSSSKPQCTIQDVINQKIEEDFSSLRFSVTACTCGSACGSGDVRAETTCHCQCAGMDWTGARCCRLQGRA